MFLTTAHLSLLSYYAGQQESKIPEVYRIDNEKELNRVLSLGSPFSPKLSVIEYKGKFISDPKVSIFNQVYLSLPNKDYNQWKRLPEQYNWIKILNLYPELYKKPLQDYSYLFDEEAYDYFWEKYKNYPKKLKAELTILLLRNSVKRTKFTLDDLLFSSNETNIFLSICRNLGTPENNKQIFQLSDSNLYQLFIGSDNKPSYIYYYLVGSKRKEGMYPELYQAVEILRESVANKLITIGTGAVLLNQWIGQLEKEKVKHKKFTYKVTYKQLTKIESLLLL